MAVIVITVRMMFIILTVVPDVKGAPLEESQQRYEQCEFFQIG